MHLCLMLLHAVEAGCVVDAHVLLLAIWPHVGFLQPGVFILRKVARHHLHLLLMLDARCRAHITDDRLLVVHLLAHHCLMLLLGILLLIFTCLVLHHLDVLNVLRNMHMPQTEASIRYDRTEPLLAVGVLYELILLRLLIILIVLNHLRPLYGHSIFVVLMVLLLLLLVLLVRLHHVVVHCNWLSHFIYLLMVAILIILF